MGIDALSEQKVPAAFSHQTATIDQCQLPIKWLRQEVISVFISFSL